MPAKQNYKTIALGICAIFLEILYLLYTVLSASHGIKQNIMLYMIVYGIAFMVFGYSWYLIRSQGEAAPVQKWLLPFIIVSGLLFRATLIPTEHSTSDDYYRYVWEGKMIANGYNPYEYAPGDSTLNKLHSSILPEKVTFKNLTTIYPPVAQVVFTVAYLIGGETTLGLKVIFLFAEIFTLLLIIKLLRYACKDTRYVLLYAWLPLPIMEYMINAHIDVAALPFFLAFILFVLKEKPVPAAIMFAICFLTKSYAVFAIPLLLYKISYRKILLFVPVASVIVIAAYIPFLNQRHSLTDMLSTYLVNWEFNGSFYNVFKLITLDGIKLRMMCLALLAISILYVSFAVKLPMNKLTWIYICVAACTTTVYPWYLGWLAVLLPFTEFYSVVVLFFMINFTNITPYGQIWREHYDVIFIEYLIFYLVLFFDLKRHKEELIFTYTADKT